MFKIQYRISGFIVLVSEVTLMSQGLKYFLLSLSLKEKIIHFIATKRNMCSRDKYSIIRISYEGRTVELVTGIVPLERRGP